MNDDHDEGESLPSRENVLSDGSEWSGSDHEARRTNSDGSEWSDDDHAGFTDGEPWIDANPNYPTVNVERERADPDSVLSYYRELIDLRSSTPTLIYGEFRDLLPDDRQVYAYERRHEDDRIVVVLNTSVSAASVELPVGVPEGCLLSNYDESPTDLSGATLRPYEAAVYRV